MPDIFDQLAPDAPPANGPFDLSAVAQGGDIFDQVANQQTLGVTPAPNADLATAQRWQSLHKAIERGDVARGEGEAPGTLLQNLGGLLGYAGTVARAVPADIAVEAKAAYQALTGQDYDETAQFAGNIPKAIQEGARQPGQAPVKLPIDEAFEAAGEEEKGRGFPTATVAADISQGLAKAAPRMAGIALAPETLLAQSVMAGGLFGLDDEGNFHPKEAAIAALMPGVGKVARVATGALLGKGVEAGLVPLATANAHKVVESLGEQAALNAYTTAVQTPDLIKLYHQDPQAFARQLAGNIGQNLAFGLVGLPQFDERIPSETQDFIQAKATRLANALTHDPQYQAAIDEQARFNLSPQNAQYTVPEMPRPDGAIAVDPFAGIHAPASRDFVQPSIADRFIRPPDLEVPGTPAEARESSVDTIRRANARTKRQIQDLWPEAQLSREAAQQLRDLAWGPPAATQPTPTDEGGDNAEQNVSAARPNGAVLNPGGPGESPRPLPAAQGGAGIPAGGPGQALQEAGPAAGQPAAPPAGPAGGAPAVASPRGDAFTARTPVEGTPVRGRFDVVEAPQLISSFDPGYDPALQPRDRSRAASANQIADIVAKFDPHRLGNAPTTDLGAPIVDARGQVLSGNGRTTALRTLYGAGRGGVYKDWLMQNAGEFGLKPETIAGMEQPVLVRRAEDYGGLAPAEFARQSNQQQILGMGEAEKAAADAKLLGNHPELLELFRPDESGNVLAASNREFLNQFIKGTGDHAELLNKDGYNVTTLTRRVKNAVLSTLLGPEDRTLLDQVIERADDLGIKNAVNGAMAAAPALVRFKGTPYDISAALHQAFKDLAAVKTSGETVDDFLSQNQLFGDPIRTAQSDALLKHLAEAKSAKAVSDGLGRYAAQAKEALADSQNGGMFGLEPASRQQILDRVYGNDRNTQGAPHQPGGESQDQLGLGPAPSRPEDANAPAGAPTGAGEALVHAAATSAARARKGVQRVSPPNPQPSPTPLPALPEVARNFLKDADAVRKVFAPQARGDNARFAGNLLRQLQASMRFELDRADTALRPFRNAFDRTPVPKTWQYNPNADLPFNYGFIDAYESGQVAGLDPQLQRAADTMRDINEQWLDRIANQGGNALKTFIENYFPHIWKDPEAAKKAFAGILSRRPLEGTRSFLKQRTKQLFRDGLAAGLTPAHDNPVDLFMLKHREVEKFILARRFVNEMKAAGLLKFVHAFAGKPEGWATVDDSAFTVHGPPYVTAQEAYDAGMRTKTLELLKLLGMPHERLPQLENPNWWGVARSLKGVPGSESIQTKFGGPPDVIWHELGHGLDSRYPDLQRRLFNGPLNKAELRALADARAGGKPVPQSYRDYLRSTPEKMAVALQAYIHAPELMRQIAPRIQAEYKAFIAEHPELKLIDEIKPTLEMGEGTAQLKVNGIVKLGNWYMPAEAAQVVKNYLSPGLQRFKTYEAIRATSNLLNAAQLGFSAFHLGFTSLDAAVSRLAAGLEDFSHGDIGRGLRTAASTPLSPITNIVRGSRVKAEVLRPGSQDPEVGQIAKALEAAGGRVGNDQFWKTEFTRRMLRSFHEATASGYIKGVLSAPLALVEQTMRPIMDYIVPRQKLGVFADLARRELDRLGPNAKDADVREAMGKAWDSVDNRMGQLTYDNLFYNRVAKDVALLGFRAYGWQLGKYRELGGGVYDVAKAGKALMSGQRPAMTHRMAYMLALPMVIGTAGAILNRLFTGENPKDWHDYFMPRTGELDANGNPQRVNLPSYLKDLIGAQHNIARGIANHGPIVGTLVGAGQTINHQLNPGISAIADMLMNRDFYDTRIFNPDDPMLKQLAQQGLYLGKEFRPFSISNGAKLAEDGAPLQKQILPFFGITPASSRLSMSPAQELAAETYANSFPRGAMPPEQFEKAKLLKQIVQMARSADPAKRDAWMGKYRDAVAAGQLTPESLETIITKARYNPLQFQVHQMGSDDAMRVWRVASPAEKQQIRDILRAKIANSQKIPADQKIKWLNDLKP